MQPEAICCLSPHEKTNVTLDVAVAVKAPSSAALPHCAAAVGAAGAVSAPDGVHSPSAQMAGGGTERLLGVCNSGFQQGLRTT